MSATQLKVWQFNCDLCKRKSDLIYSPFTPSLPMGWAEETYEGGGHYGLPLHTETQCPVCKKKAKRK
jgi:hypothetical protein